MVEALVGLLRILPKPESMVLRSGMKKAAIRKHRLKKGEEQFQECVFG